MTWFGWLMSISYAVSGLYYIARIGKHREPITPTEAAIQIVLISLYIWGFATVGTVQ